ncbi:minor tail protein [Microbacterium phage Milani]|nr:minor tail protein [Microbacterium phage Milani]
MARVLALSSAGGSVVLGEESGIKAGLNVRGTGMPGVELQWFEGAGEGKTLQGGRALGRTVDMPIKFYGANRGEVQEKYSEVGRILLVENAPVLVTLELDGEAWRSEMVRTGGGDFTYGQDTDGSTYLKTVVTMESGSPYWTRVDSEARVITPGGLGIPLLGPGQSLSQLRLSNTEGSGAVQFTNTGDVAAWPTWRFLPPFQNFLLSRDGMVLAFNQAAVKTTGYIDIDSKAGTIVDENGVNRYDLLGAAPKFFSIPRGTTSAQVVLNGATSDTRVNVAWHPRKVVLF